MDCRLLQQHTSASIFASLAKRNVKFTKFIKLIFSSIPADELNTDKYPGMKYIYNMYRQHTAIKESKCQSPFDIFWCILSNNTNDMEELCEKLIHRIYNPGYYNNGEFFPIGISQDTVFDALCEFIDNARITEEADPSADGIFIFDEDKLAAVAEFNEELLSACISDIHKDGRTIAEIESQETKEKNKRMDQIAEMLNACEILYKNSLVVDRIKTFYIIDATWKEPPTSITSLSITTKEAELINGKYEYITHTIIPSVTVPIKRIPGIVNVEIIPFTKSGTDICWDINRSAAHNRILYVVCGSPITSIGNGSHNTPETNLTASTTYCMVSNKSSRVYPLDKYIMLHYTNVFVCRRGDILNTIDKAPKISLLVFHVSVSNAMEDKPFKSYVKTRIKRIVQYAEYTGYNTIIFDDINTKNGSCTGSCMEILVSSMKNARAIEKCYIRTSEENFSYVSALIDIMKM